MINRAIEALEARRFLSATLKGGVLSVSGTTGNDQIYISISADLTHPTNLQKAYFVNLNGQGSEFPFNDVRRIVIRCGGGNDLVDLGFYTFAVDAIFTEFVSVPVTIRGESGSDRLYGGGRRSILRGNAGDDTLDTSRSRGRTRLEGGGGSDLLNGSRGGDLLIGGSGADIIQGDYGDDSMYGGSGNDTIDGGNGTDLIFGGSGEDLIHGDAGNDILFGGGHQFRNGLDSDSLFGGEGSDRFSFVTDRLAEMIDYTAGVDPIPFSFIE